MESAADRSLFRHALATLAYRACRALEGAPEGFCAFNGAGKTPGQILAHMCDLLDWALATAAGHPSWHNSKPLGWEEQKQRFFQALTRFDLYLASGEPVHGGCEKLLQGPVADALTHVGQLAMLRRLAGAPAEGENFYVAAIEAGRAGCDQASPCERFRR